MSPASERLGAITARGVPQTARHNLGGTPHAPHPQRCFPVKRKTVQSSTTATPPARRFPLLGPRVIPVALASSTAVTLPSALRFLHGHNLPLTLAVGLLPSLILLLIAVPFIAMYTAASVFAIVATAGRIARGGDSSADCLDDLFRWITNIPVAFLTLTPLKERHVYASGRPLPSAGPSPAGKADTPVFWEAVQEMSSRPGGATDIVDQGEPVTEPTHEFQGKHARPDDPGSQRPEQPTRVRIYTTNRPGA